jgi:hypothetical protein
MSQMDQVIKGCLSGSARQHFKVVPRTNSHYCGCGEQPPVWDAKMAERSVTRRGDMALVALRLCLIAVTLLFVGVVGHTVWKIAVG